MKDISDTPETEAASFRAKGHTFFACDRLVSAAFAERLERERDAARREAVIERDRHCHPDHGGHLFSWENGQCPATERSDVGSD